MLSAFPDLFTYGLLAPLVLRFALALFMGNIGVRSLKKLDKKLNTTVYGFFNVLIAILLVIGLFTQVAALLSLLIIALEWRLKKEPGAMWRPDRMVMILAGAIAVSLLFSGAGFYAFDLPL